MKKPFDLQAALNGAEVVTRDGRMVTQLTLFDVSDDENPLRGLVHEKHGHRWVTDWPISGIDEEGYENDKDLFMSGFLRLSDAEICDVFVSTQGKDDFTLARAIEDALEAKNK